MKAKTKATSESTSIGVCLVVGLFHIVNWTSWLLWPSSLDMLVYM